MRDFLVSLGFFVSHSSNLDLFIEVFNPFKLIVNIGKEGFTIAKTYFITNFVFEFYLHDCLQSLKFTYLTLTFSDERTYSFILKIFLSIFDKY